MLNPNIVASDDCYVIDESGKRYIDFEAGVWSASLGHNNKQINETIIRQVNSISHVGYRYSTKIVNDAARKVLELLNFEDGKCVFLSSGSEAVEFAVQVARRITEKPYFLCLKNHYLSAYGLAGNRNEEQWLSLDLSKYNGNVDHFLRNVPFDKIGVFVFEPGNASGTVQLPPKELIKAIGDKIKKHHGMMVINEVTTGIGRTGKWFGFLHYDIKPDIVACGKGIGNGYPVSVIALSKKVVAAIQKTGFRYAQSHQDDPLGCAVINEVISIIKDHHLIERAARMGKILKQELISLSQKHKCVKEIRGIGLMFVMEFSKDAAICPEVIHKELFDAGYITGFHPVASLLRFYPPLTIKEGQIKSMANELDTILLRYD